MLVPVGFADKYEPRPPRPGEGPPGGLRACADSPHPVLLLRSRSPASDATRLRDRLAMTGGTSRRAGSVRLDSMPLKPLPPHAPVAFAAKKRGLRALFALLPCSVSDSDSARAVFRRRGRGGRAVSSPLSKRPPLGGCASSSRRIRNGTGHRILLPAIRCKNLPPRQAQALSKTPLHIPSYCRMR